MAPCGAYTGRVTDSGRATPTSLATLHSLRLRLRSATEDDVGFVRDLYSRPEVTEFIGSTEWVETTAEQALTRIARYRGLAGPSTGCWLVETLEDQTLRDRAVGFALLKPIPWSKHLDVPGHGPMSAVPQDIEIGWHLHPDAWGHGYATEAAQALLAHGRRRQLERLVAVTHAENLPSQRVAQRIGMTHRGTTDRYYDTACELFTIDL